MSQLFDAPVTDDKTDPFPKTDESLSGNPRTEARLCAIQAIFQHCLTEEPLLTVADTFRRTELGPREANVNLFKDILADLNTEVDRYKILIEAHLTESWSLERLPLVELSILLCACAELDGHPKTPLSVILNEYINIAKGFLEESKVGFVNSMLDAIARKVRGLDDEEEEL